MDGVLTELTNHVDGPNRCCDVEVLRIRPLNQFG